MLSLIVTVLLGAAPARAVQLIISHELTDMATVPQFAKVMFQEGLALLDSPELKPLD